MPVQPERRPQKKKPQLEAPDVSEMIDLHLRFGLEDMAIRLHRKDWSAFLDAWVIAGEDVILRSSYRKHETNIVLRGTYHAVYTVTRADPDKNLPVYNAFPVSDLRKKVLAEQGAG